ncbi:hypothetical protein CYMTET_29767, partial [Cymbomonas tetramitiformis]
LIGGSAFDHLADGVGCGGCGYISTVAEAATILLQMPRSQLVQVVDGYGVMLGCFALQDLLDTA